MGEVTVTQADAELVADILELADTLVLGGNDIAGIRQGLWNEEPNDLGRLLRRAAKARIAHSATPSVADVIARLSNLASDLETWEPELLEVLRLTDEAAAMRKWLDGPASLSPRPLPSREDVEDRLERAIERVCEAISTEIRGFWTAEDLAEEMPGLLRKELSTLLNREAQA